MFSNFTIFVNSSDGFEDCWFPFFTLLKKQWPNCNIPILLNTEFKDFQYEGLNIICTKVHEGILERKLTWSECLIRGLSKVNTPFILYMQEDYFLEQRVQYEIISSFLYKMDLNKDIKYIGLTDIGNYGPFKDFIEDSRLVIVGNNKYRISTQAALWDVCTLKSYVVPEENGWMFEIFGSIRAKKRNDLFLTSNRKYFSRDNNAILYYVHTGVIKGKWHPSVKQLFSENELDLDYSLRGFYKPKFFLFRKIETLRKVLSNKLVLYKLLKS